MFELLDQGAPVHQPGQRIADRQGMGALLGQLALGHFLFQVGVDAL